MSAAESLEVRARDALGGIARDDYHAAAARAHADGLEWVNAADNAESAADADQCRAYAERAFRAALHYASAP